MNARQNSYAPIQRKDKTEKWVRKLPTAMYVKDDMLYFLRGGKGGGGGGMYRIFWVGNGFNKILIFIN